MPIPPGPDVPQDDSEDEANGPDDGETLDEQTRARAANSPTPPEAWVIHEIIREDGEREIRRTLASLAWSGFGAGLSMGFSFLALALMRAGLPEAGWSHLVWGFGYTVGFLIAVLGRQQLFTESTLTAVLPFLKRRDRASFVAIVRLWAVVLAANLVGTFGFAALISFPDLFDGPVVGALKAVSIEALHDPFWPMALKAVLSGWLIALMVWLLPGAGPARLTLIVVLTYFVAVGQLSHMIAGSVEVAYAVINGHATLGDYVTRFAIPTFLGNTVGGVSLVAVLNHAPVSGEIHGATDRQERLAAGRARS